MMSSQTLMELCSGSSYSRLPLRSQHIFDADHDCSGMARWDDPTLSPREPELLVFLSKSNTTNVQAPIFGITTLYHCCCFFSKSKLVGTAVPVCFFAWKASHPAINSHTRSCLQEPSTGPTRVGSERRERLETAETGKQTLATRDQCVPTPMPNGGGVWNLTSRASANQDDRSPIAWKGLRRPDLSTACP